VSGASGGSIHGFFDGWERPGPVPGSLPGSLEGLHAWRWRQLIRQATACFRKNPGKMKFEFEKISRTDATYPAPLFTLIARDFARVLNSGGVLAIYHDGQGS